MVLARVREEGEWMREGESEGEGCKVKEEVEGICQGKGRWRVKERECRRELRWWPDR